MKISDILDNDLIDLDVRLSLRLVAKIPFLGKKELVEVKLRGFEDEDGDLKPEFFVELEFLDRDTIPPTNIELDPKLVVGALAGTTGGLQNLFAAVADGLDKKGIKLPLSMG